MLIYDGLHYDALALAGTNTTTTTTTTTNNNNST